MAELPMEILLYHILPWLPTKSVIRFMTVSKEFHSFFKTQKFIKLHLHNVINNHHNNNDKLLVLSRTNPLFSTINHKAAPDDVLTLPSRPVPFLTYYPPHITMLTSFHGLICVGIQTTELGSFSDLVLWNPVTGDYKILSKTNSFYGTDLHTFGLSYSSLDDDYKLVHATEVGNVYIYSLKSDSWKKLDQGSTMDQRRPVYRVWLNENLYLLRYRPFAIMKLDVKTEMLTDITPYLPGLDWGNLIVHNGCIHFFVTYNGTEASNILEFEMWRLNKDGDWTKIDAGKILDARSLSLEKKSVQVRILGDMATQRYTETLVSPNRYRNN